MTARAAATLASVLAVLAVAACGTAVYEIPIETPIQPKLDTSPFQRVLVVGFVAGGTEDVDANLETVRLLRSQLRTKSNLRVIEADVVSLLEAPPPQAAAGRRRQAGRDRSIPRRCPRRSATRRTSRPTSTSSRTRTTGRSSARSSRTR